MNKYVTRDYRRLHGGGDLAFEQIIVGQSDLHIGTTVPCRDLAIKALNEARSIIEAEIVKYPSFLTTLVSMDYDTNGVKPPVSWMYAAAKLADVGPMAAVAGSVSRFVGEALSSVSQDVIVENGGDLYIITTKERKVSIYAGESPLSNKLALVIPRGTWGICTSAGRVGPSLSFGQADAAVVLATNCALADAVATAMGNHIKRPDDLENAVMFAHNISGVAGALAIMDDKIAAIGAMQLAPATP